MTDNLNRSKGWAMWRWKMDDLFNSWPLFFIATKGPNVVAHACRAAPQSTAVNDNEATT